MKLADAVAVVPPPEVVGIGLANAPAAVRARE
jgi:hypothetical protein